MGFVLHFHTNKDKYRQSNKKCFFILKYTSKKKREKAGIEKLFENTHTHTRNTNNNKTPQYRFTCVVVSWNGTKGMNVRFPITCFEIFSVLLLFCAYCARESRGGWSVIVSYDVVQSKTQRNTEVI